MAPQNLTSVEDVWSELAPTLMAELAILTGKELSDSFKEEWNAFPKEAFVDLLGVFRRLEAAPDEPLDSDSAREIYGALNEIAKLVIDEVPGGESPLEYLKQRIQQMAEGPSQYRSPHGLNYAEKHRSISEFVQYLTHNVPRADIDKFCKDTWIERRITVPIQKAANELLMPTEFLEPPCPPNAELAYRLISALSGASADWEQSVDLIYGLICLRNHATKDWQEIREVALFNESRSDEQN